MQTPILTAQEIAVIARALDVHATEKGTRRILGAQLGAIINEAVRPKHLRELGGMRHIATSSLTNLVLPTVSSPGDPDAIFEIIARPPQVAAARVPEIPTEVAGSDLWRLFSNPRLPCELVATSAGAILASTPQDGRTTSQSALGRPTAQDYHQLATQFASQEEEPYRTKLEEVLSSDDFYNSWIAALRFLRTPKLNLLKRWETVRSEFVSSQLYASLISAGVETVRASQIVAAARPAVSQRAGQHQGDGQSKAELSPSVAEVFVSKPVSSADELSTLRKILHDAIDRMSLVELREIRVPAGALVNANTR